MKTGPVSPTRRHVVRGAAWTAPVVLVAAAAPVFAASACVGTGTCPDLAFGAPSGTAGAGGTNGAGKPAAGNGWTATVNGIGWVNSNPVGFVVNGSGASLADTSEPTTAGRTVTATQTGQPALRGGCGYTLTFQINYYIASGASDLRLDAVFGDGTVVAMYTTAGKSGQNVTTGPLSVAVHATPRARCPSAAASRRRVPRTT